MNDGYFLDRIARRDAKIRASDEDRERVAERLRTGHAEGRLDLAEFQERLDRCYEAKTFGQLTQLVSDLPRPQERTRRGSSGWFRAAPWVPLLGVLVALIVISAVTSHHVVWFWIPLIFVFFRLSSWRRRRWWPGPYRGW